MLADIWEECGRATLIHFLTAKAGKQVKLRIVPLLNKVYQPFYGSPKALRISESRFGVSWSDTESWFRESLWAWCPLKGLDESNHVGRYIYIGEDVGKRTFMFSVPGLETYMLLLNRASYSRNFAKIAGNTLPLTSAYLLHHFLRQSPPSFSEPFARTVYIK